ncbi:hypothetical protein [Burkholderia sp. WAC0059]|uniref:hypothetical protein n=1 Tax=Burkholderia sp. WAC0059 TaxID=2066022 RepID=UPI0011AF997C|nr:hypothetical protein [Burkholderia sp. WAC0059]
MSLGHPPGTRSFPLWIVLLETFPISSSCFQSSVQSWRIVELPGEEGEEDRSRERLNALSRPRLDDQSIVERKSDLKTAFRVGGRHFVSRSEICGCGDDPPDAARR